MRERSSANTLAVCLLLAASARASAQWESRVVQPKTYIAPSGHYRLWVNPDVPDGSTSARYRLQRDSKVLWEKRLPFTLIQAGVADDGRFGGYGYRKAGDTNSFVVGIGSADGTVVLEEPHPQTPSRFPDSAANPNANGLIFDGPNDRIVVRVSDPDLNRNHESWWSYRLSNGARIATLDPRASMEPEVRFVIRARPVPGTPLTLVNWWKFDGKATAVFTLVDEQARPVWRLNLEGDYETAGTEKERIQQILRFQRNGTILRTDQVRRFEILSSEKKERITYRVTESNQRWHVSEVARVPYVESAPPPAKPAPTAVIPLVKLPLRRRFALPVVRRAPSPIHDVDAFTLPALDRVAVLRGGPEPALVVANGNGQEIKTIPLPFGLATEGEMRHLISAGPTQAIVIRSNLGKNTSAQAWKVDLTIGKANPLRNFPTIPVTSAAAFPDGSLAVLRSEHHAASITFDLALLSPNGSLRWRLGDDGGYGGKSSELLSPEAVTIDAQGMIVVLDNVRHTLQRFTKEGKFVELIDLNKAWGRAPEYPTSILTTSRGFLLWDVSRLYDLLPDGRIASDRTPKFTDGKTLESLNDPQVDSEGNAWVGTRDALFRLDSKGVVDRIIGDFGEPTGLAGIAALTVSPKGRIYALDRTSGEVHAYEPDGKRVLVAKPASGDFSSRPIGGMHVRLATTDAGGIYVSYGEATDKLGYVHFSPTGKRLGFQEKSAEPTKPAAWKPTWRWDELTLLGEKSQELLRIRRWPNGDWIDSPRVGVAPDGSLAAYQPALRSGTSHAGELAFYSPTGTPSGMVKVVTGLKDLYDIAYDGQYVYFPRATDVVAVDKNGRPRWRLALPKTKGEWRVYPIENGIALFDGLKTVYWYDLPKTTLAGSKKGPGKVVRNTARPIGRDVQQKVASPGAGDRPHR